MDRRLTCCRLRDEEVEFYLRMLEVAYALLFVIGLILATYSREAAPVHNDDIDASPATFDERFGEWRGLTLITKTGAGLTTERASHNLQP